MKTTINYHIIQMFQSPPTYQMSPWIYHIFPSNCSLVKSWFSSNSWRVWPSLKDAMYHRLLVYAGCLEDDWIMWWLIVVFIGYKPTTMGILWWSDWWFGTWMDQDFSFSWECHSPNWRTPSFFRGVDIPPTRFVWSIYPLVNIQKTMGNRHRNSWFSC